jgi:general secretion pathway protein J
MKMNFLSSAKIRQQRAFTLIEMLVVMIIVAMLVTLIVQGFGYSLGLYQRVVKTQANAYQQAFFYHWFTSSLQSQVAMRLKDRGLEGNQYQLSTYTYSPLIGMQGMKTLVHWELETKNNNLTLVYREGAQHFVVNSWMGATGQFQYMNVEKNWSNDWLPKKDEIKSLPRTISLQVYQDGETFNYVVNTETRQRAIITMEEITYGRE